MATPADILKEIHRLRRYVQDLATRSEQGPRARKLQQDKLARQEETLRVAQDALKHLKVQIHEKEVSIKTDQELVKKYERQLKENITSKKEYDALTAEINQTRSAIGKLEDETLEALSASEEQTARLPEIEAATRKAREDFARFDQDQADNLRRFAEEKARALAELKAAEVSLTDDIRPLYERLAAAKGADALAGVQGGVCSACYTEVTPQMASELRRGTYLICKNCGRILYAD
jgi:predicted  nucleic acid-binding Zn-ribbon protein